jgi:hypothetical protein
MAAGDLVRAASGHLVYEPGGHLVYKSWVAFPRTEYVWNKDYTNFAYGAGVGLADVYPGAWAQLQAMYWIANFPVLDAMGGWWQYPTEAYCHLKASLLIFDTTTYRGRTMDYIRLGFDWWFENGMGTALKMALKSDDNTIPDSSWAWTVNGSVVTIPFAGRNNFPVSPVITLGNTLWITLWLDPYDLDPNDPNKRNRFESSMAGLSLRIL